MKKQEIIKEAYGKSYDGLKDFINENGFVDCVRNRKISLIPFFDVSEIEFDGHLSRPKSLKGLEKNNGWIKIEEKEITKWNDSFDIVFTDKRNIYTYATYCNFSSIYEIEKITHFQQITKPENPLY